MSVTSCQSQDLSPTLTSHEFRVIHDLTFVNALSVGYLSVDVTHVTQVKVLPGDHLAWMVDTHHSGKIAFMEESSAIRGFTFKGQMTDKTFVVGQPRNTFNLVFALGARIVPLSTTNVSFHVDRVAIYPISLTVLDSNNNKENSSAEVATQQIIGGLSLDTGLEYVFQGQMRNFTVNISNGTNVTYHWQFGKDQPKKISQTTSVTHAFASRGAQNVSVFAINNVSWADIQCYGWPYVLSAVENLTIPELPPVEVHQNLTITVVLAQGSLVDLNISLGDNSEHNLSKIEVGNVFIVSINHSYDVEGIFTVRALAKNVISHATAQRNLTVQLPIVGLNVSVPQEIQSSFRNLQINVSVSQGTDVFYKVTLHRDGLLITTETASGNFSTVVFSRDILKPGTASLVVTALNLVSSLACVEIVSFAEPITGASLNPESNAFKTQSSMKFEGSFKTGSNVSITFQKSINHRNMENIPLQHGTNFWSDTARYSSPGIYTARANYSNALSYEVVDKEIIIQDPVDKVLLITDVFVSLPPGIVKISVAHIGSVTTNATTRLSFGDGTAEEIVKLTPVHNTSHRYANINFSLIAGGFDRSPWGLSQPTLDAFQGR